MKILVMSDTHGNSTAAFLAHTRSEPVDIIIHLGDGAADADSLRNILDMTVINVSGNCDTGSSAPRECVWECEGKRILLTHGDAYHVKSGLTSLRQRAEEVGADAALFGHTHRAVVENHSGILLLNPGTLFNSLHQRSYAILVVTVAGITTRHFTID